MADVTQAEFLAAFGIQEQVPATGETPPEGEKDKVLIPDTEEPEEGDGPKEGAPTEPSGDTKEEPPAEPAPDKSGQRFAAMRVQLKQYETLLKDVAGLLKVEADDPDKMRTAIEDAVLKAQAKTSNVPEELLRQTKQNNEELTALRREQHVAATYGQFQKVMDTFKISQGELKAYAEQLAASGIDPFDATQKLDLVEKYKVLNFDKLLKKAQDEAIAAEQARATKAQTHSSKPNAKQGSGSGDPAKVTTQFELQKFLDTAN